MASPWIVPAGALALGLIALAYAKWEAWRFDRKHPNLTRQATRDREPRP